MERTDNFDELQRRMADQLGRRGVSDLSTGTIVVLPSITFPRSELKKIIGIEHYEERMLCMTLLLRRPTVEIVYFSSMPIADAVIDYYLGFVPDAAGVRERLHLIDVGDPSPSALSEKLLEHPELLDRARDAIPEPDCAYLFPFNVTELERAIAERMGIPIYGPHPELADLGSKSGGRKLAQVAGVPVAPGSEDLYSIDEVEQAAFTIAETVPGCDAVVVKLNNGFSGQGNAIIEMSQLTSPIDRTPVTFCANEESWPTFAEKIAAEGAIVEQLVRAPGMSSPSVQLRVFPTGEYEVVSTHDQVLGGPDDQVYLGCRFPANAEYRHQIQGYGLGIARELAAHGVVGTFGVDFIVPPDGRVFMSEINLRLGGTTHPFLMARFATKGAYDTAAGELRVGDDIRVYVATDNIKSEQLVGQDPATIIKSLEASGISYDAASASGVLLHLLGATERYGKLGAVCIAPTAAACDDLYRRLLEAVGVE